LQFFEWTRRPQFSDDNCRKLSHIAGLYRALMSRLCNFHPQIMDDF